MCHESSGTALNQVIGVGKGTVDLDDINDYAELIIIAGQNPGTNHPRMLTALEKAKKRHARIVSVNPLPEAGLIRFKNPQTPKGLIGDGTKLSDRHLAVRVNGDLALFAGLNKILLEREERAPGAIFDDEFITPTATASRRRVTPGARSTGRRSSHRADSRDRRSRASPMRSSAPRASSSPGRWGHPAPQCGGDDSRDRELPPAPGKYRATGSGTVPGSWSQQRPGS